MRCASTPPAPEARSIVAAAVFSLALAAPTLATAQTPPLEPGHGTSPAASPPSEAQTVETPAIEGHPGDGHAAENHAGGEHEDESHHGEGHGEGHGESGEEEAHGHMWHAGVTGAFNYSSATGEGSHGGVGAFVEYSLIHEVLEVELGVHLFPGADASALPIDLLFKHPFELSERIHPFVGLGPTIVPRFGSAGGKTLFGGVVEAGSYFWLTHHVGLLAQVAYNLLGGAGEVVHEFQADGGVVFGW